MFQFPALPSLWLWIHHRIPAHYHRGVPAFGHLWFDGCLHLPTAFRSLPRPSSAPSAKAFTLCSFLLNHFTRLSSTSLWNKSFVNSFDTCVRIALFGSRFLEIVVFLLPEFFSVNHSFVWSNSYTLSISFAVCNSLQTWLISLYIIQFSRYSFGLFESSLLI